MLKPDLNSQIYIFDTLPPRVQSAIVAYAEAAQISVSMVVEVALRYFLELDIQDAKEATDASEMNSMRTELPPVLQTRIAAYANEHQMPVEFVV